MLRSVNLDQLNEKVRDEIEHVFHPAVHDDNADEEELEQRNTEEKAYQIQKMEYMEEVKNGICQMEQNLELEKTKLNKVTKEKHNKQKELKRLENALDELYKIAEGRKSKEEYKVEELKK